MAEAFAHDTGGGGARLETIERLCAKAGGHAIPLFRCRLAVCLVLSSLFFLLSCLLSVGFGGGVGREVGAGGGVRTYEEACENGEALVQENVEGQASAEAEGQGLPQPEAHEEAEAEA